MKTHERIRMLRKHLNMSQEEFGEALGTSRDVIGNIEYGRLKRPDQKEPLYRLICEKFDVSEEWLSSGDGEMFRSLTRSEAISDFMVDLLKEENESFKRRFIEAFANLDIEDWKDLERIASKMVKEKG